MKKLLLTGIAAIVLCFAASAQSTYVLYSGNDTTDFINGTPYSFNNGLSIVDSLKIGAKHEFYYMSGTATNYYVGGVGAGSYGAAGNPTISYSGAIANTTVSITVNPKGSAEALIVVFKNTASGNAWGYTFTILASSTPTTITAPLSAFQKRDPSSYQLTGAAPALSDLQTVDAFEFGLSLTSNGGVGFAELEFDNFELINNPPTTSTDYVLYSGNDTTDFINGTPYSFNNGLSIVDSLKIGAKHKFYYMSGTATNYYIGGVGTGSYGTPSNPTISYSGAVANTTVSITVNPKGSNEKLRVLFRNSTQAWGYDYIIPASTTPITITAPLDSFKLRDGSNNLTGVAPALSDLQTVDAFEFDLTLLSNSGVGFAALELDSLVLVSTTTVVLGIADQNIASNSITVYPNPCNTGVLNLGAEMQYTMTNAIGVTVKTGVGSNIDVSNLEKGMYLISTGTGKTSKVILN